MTYDLAALPVDVIIAFAVFTRVGAMMMTAPAFGDFSLSPRVRLVAALAVAAAMTPGAATFYPDWRPDGHPDGQLGGQLGGLGALTALLGGEIVVGVFLGLTARMLMSALNVAGQIIALQMGLSLAQIFDPTQDLQGAIIGGFLAVLGTTLVFVTDAHHLLIAALSDSYAVFAPGFAPAIFAAPGDMAAFAIDAMSQAFSLGLRLAAPFIVFGLVFFMGAGLLNRLMPQAQIFFIAMPANLLLGLLLLMLTVGLMMTVFLGAFEDFLAGFVG